MTRVQADRLASVMRQAGWRGVCVALATPKRRGYCVSHADAVFGHRQITEWDDARAVRLISRHEAPSAK